VPRRSWRTVGRAAVIAGLLSGAPSTAHALVTRRPLLASTRAAGTLLGRPTLARGVLAHAAMTGWWSAVLVTVLPSRSTVAWGAAAGLTIGIVDLGVATRRFPAIAALPRAPQLADHVAFGAVVGAAVASGPPQRPAR
jgi:hypothetical protein